MAEKLLIVDDEKDTLKLVSLMLERQGYEVVSALDGPTALELVKSEKPDLILLDIMMPGMDGFEVCEKLKSSPETASIAVIFMTGKTDKEDKDKGIALGAIDYIFKPFDIEDVQTRIKTHLLKITEA